LRVCKRRVRFDGRSVCPSDVKSVIAWPWSLLLVGAQSSQVPEGTQADKGDSIRRDLQTRHSQAHVQPSERPFHRAASHVLTTCRSVRWRNQLLSLGGGH
jgi:hypothetical protein